MEPIISWEAPDREYVAKNSDWYWGVGIVSFTAAALAFMFGQVIFGILIVMCAVALTLRASVPARTVSIQINDRGIVMDKTLYPFLTLDSFWIDPQYYPSKILVKSHKMLMPYLIFRIADDVDPEQIRQVLLNYIAETEHEEPLSVKVLERLGF